MESFYMSAEALAKKGVPKYLLPNDRESEQVNDLYDQYIFYRSAEPLPGRFISATCCGRVNEYFPTLVRTETPEYRSIIRGRHGEIVKCPWCGRRAKMICEGRYRCRSRLEQYKPVVFLRNRGRRLEALALWTMKKCGDEKEIADGVLCKAVEWYSFEPGKVVVHGLFGNLYAYKDEMRRTLFSPDSKMKDLSRITEPFKDGTGYMWHREPYFVYGLEALERNAFFRYCQYDTWNISNQNDERHSYLIRYLALAALYPKDVEMLVKRGLGDLVTDFVVGRKKNADIYDWGSTDPKAAFGLNGQELRTWTDNGRDIDVLRLYRKMKRVGMKGDLDLAQEISAELGCSSNDFLTICRQTRLKPVVAIHRLERWAAELDVNQWGVYDVGSVFELWKDYVTFCDRLGYDLAAKTVAMPSDLLGKHDAAAAEIARTEAAGQNGEDAECVSFINRRAKKYDFAMGDLFIRVAVNRREIVNEGNALKHCVGGLAIDHIEGKTTILFLRRKSAPGKSLVTVEMHGNRIVQAHGYKNDANAESPRKTYKKFFDTWLDWLKRGSPRNEDGTPKMRKKKGSNAA